MTSVSTCMLAAQWLLWGNRVREIYGGALYYRAVAAYSGAS